MDNQNYQNNSYEQSGYQQPNYQQPVPPQEPKKTDALAVIALVLGIASIVICCNIYLSIALGIGGIVCSVISNKKQKSGLATAGMVCSIVGMVLAVLAILFSVGFLAMMESYGYDISSLINM